MPKEEGFVSGRMVGAKTAPTTQPARINRPVIRDGKPAYDRELKTQTPGWIMEPRNPAAEIIARDAIKRPVELNTEAYMKVAGLFDSRIPVGTEMRLWGTGFSLWPFMIQFREGQDPIDGAFREDMVKDDITASRYEALYNDPELIKDICQAFLKDVPDPTQKGKYLARAKHPRIPGGTKIRIVNLKSQYNENESHLFTTCGGLNIYICEVIEGPATGFRFLQYDSTLSVANY